LVADAPHVYGTVNGVILIPRPVLSPISVVSVESLSTGQNAPVKVFPE